MRIRALAAATLATALTLLATGTAQAAVTISQGHVDALDIDWTGSSLTLDIRDHTVSPAIDRDPSTVTLNAVTASKTTVPSSSAYAFLGSPGSPVWILPQSQASGILWPGFSTEGVPTGALQGNSVTAKLISVTGPAHFSTYTTNAFGTPTVWFDSGNGLPDSRALTINTHSHANWAFEAAGTYTLVFEVTATTSAGAAVSAGQKSYTVTVQP
ncbi:choice-of-anchor M domain-containing protein [Lentzea flaviverrucosa]|uniref:Surface-anchored protein n=1 Tax=Lentzea flaviverrucosa TaxID=200379 RepID=A0A1H9F5S7_9PSEU|nr:choice-of-anchor M domain-containing protein [Lentzea flaviverrucosa]RDI35300.1 surface-anchored protein [Lentzea flaviverrucosa]SEQ33235.1 surface-anchored protein [Lentzea flaviverrucosa]